MLLDCFTVHQAAQVFILEQIFDVQWQNSNLKIGFCEGGVAASLLSVTLSRDASRVSIEARIYFNYNYYLLSLYLPLVAGAR